MLVGLFRVRCDGGGRFGLAQVLWRQGLIWLLLAAAAEIPPLVLNTLHLNDPLDSMFQLPSWVTMAIAGTRMYRSLADFASRSTDIAHNNLQTIKFAVQETNRIDTASCPTNQMEVAVHIVSEQQVTPRMICDDLCTSTDEQMHGKLSGFRRDDNVEHNV